MFSIFFSSKKKTPSEKIQDDIEELERAISDYFGSKHYDFWKLRLAILSYKNDLNSLLKKLESLKNIIATKNNAALNMLLDTLKYFLKKRTITLEIYHAINALIQNCEKLDWYQHTIKSVTENAPDFLATVNN